MSHAPVLRRRASCGCPGEGVSRRTLLKGAAALTAAGVAAPLLDTRIAYAEDPSYAGDVLVVLSLRGGFDGLAAIAPVGDPAYVAARPTLAVPASAGLQLDSTFALHPAMAPLKPLWDAGTFGAVHAVGQPDGSRSHFMAQEELERAAPGTSIRTGWLDRVLGTRASGSALQAVSLGNPATHLSLVGPGRDVSMASLSGFKIGVNDAGLRMKLATAIASLHDGDPEVAATLRAMEDAAKAAAPAYAPTVTYPAGALGKALADVARMIKAGVGVQMAAVDFGDWDMHEHLGTITNGRFTTRLKELAEALAAFAADLGPHFARTTVVTMSEFGRRVAENGSNGTDHGYGNAVLLLGGGVVGGKVHGRWPGLAPASLDQGDLAGTTDYRDVLGELLQARCGVGDLAPVFPGFRHTPLGLARRA